MQIQHPALVLFCKEPSLGYGKQRLAADIGRFAALRVARALVQCALEDAAAWPFEFVIAPASPKQVPWAEELASDLMRYGKNAKILPQCEGNLGQRLSTMDQQLRQLGAQQILFMASDAPTLVPRYFLRALSALRSNQVVLADDLDGGVTLMGSSVPWPNLQQLPWSTKQLGDALARRCGDAGLSVYRFNGGFDVDGFEDLLMLDQFLVTDGRPARRALSLLVNELVAVPA